MPFVIKKVFRLVHIEIGKNIYSFFSEMVNIILFFRYIDFSA